MLVHRPVWFSEAGPPTMGYRAPSLLCTTIKPASLPRVRCWYSQCLIHIVAPCPLTLGAPFAACCGAQAPFSVRQPPLLRHLSDHLGPPWILPSIHVRAAASSAHLPTPRSHLPRQRPGPYGDVIGLSNDVGPCADLNQKEKTLDGHK